MQHWIKWHGEAILVAGELARGDEALNLFNKYEYMRSHNTNGREV